MTDTATPTADTARAAIAKVRSLDARTVQLIGVAVIAAAAGFTLGMRMARILEGGAAHRGVAPPPPSSPQPTAGEQAARDLSAELIATRVAAASAATRPTFVAEAAGAAPSSGPPSSDTVAPGPAAVPDLTASGVVPRTAVEPDQPAEVAGVESAGVPLEEFPDPTVQATDPLPGTLTLDRSALA